MALMVVFFYRLTESQLASDLEFTNAQVTANKTSLGSLAELVAEREEETQQAQESQIRDLRIESGQKLTDAQLALERLEFRFKHHLRDCQALAEQLEHEQEQGRALKSQLAQMQLLVDKQREQQLSLVENIQFAVASAEEKAATTASEMASKMDALQRRVASFVKKFEEDSQGERR
jgi:hypothetical protein